MSRTLYIGRSGLGKTYHLTEQLKKTMAKHPKKHMLVIVSPTAPLQKLYKPFKGKTEKYFSGINDDVTEELEEMVSKNFKKKKGRKTPIIVIDDLGESNYMKRAQKNNRLNHMIVCARHTGCHLVFLMQRMKQATPSLRDNVDHIIAFRIDDADQRKDFKKAFAGELSDEEFRKVIRHAWSKPYGYVRIDRSNTKNPKKYFSKEEHIPIKSRKF
jgi:hypothetical protein